MNSMACILQSLNHGEIKWNLSLVLHFLASNFYTNLNITLNTRFVGYHVSQQKALKRSPEKAHQILPSFQRLSDRFS